tara:strand:- start:1365 stop:2909 length:1545 start_codon:yes stop_codon:yes gene_type:complete
MSQVVEYINGIATAWQRISYGANPGGGTFNADNARDFEIQKLQLETANGKTLYDMTEMVLEFQYHESIESSFLRCDISILDAIDWNKNLQGGEKVIIKMVTGTAIRNDHLDVELVVYKIGSISKTERGQLYILHCVSPEMYHDEANKVFKSLGPGEKSKDVENIPKYVCDTYLKTKGSKKANKYNFENHSKVTFVACSWKPSDVIHYLSDKVTRLASSKGDNKQSGFLFWSNRNGFNFRSIDSIAKGEATRNGVYTYTYVQGAQEGADKRYAIETLTYPDKANHLANMRMGTYKTAAIGISLASQKDSYTPTSGKKKEAAPNESVDAVTSEGGKVSGTGLSSAPSGTISALKVLNFQQVFAKADKVVDGNDATRGNQAQPPFLIPEFYDIEKSQPTRMKIRALPGMKNQSSNSNVENGTNSNIDNIAVAQYAAARYNLFKAIKLNLTVAGNTALTAGNVIDVKIPSSTEEDEEVLLDYRFSGKYIIAGLTHIYQKKGLTTKLYLVRDSVPKQET